MTKKKTILITTAAAIMLAGCGQINSTATEKVTAPETSTATEKVTAPETSTATEARNEEAQAVISDAEADDKAALESLKSYLKEMKASHNVQPVNMKARVGEFAVWSDDEMELFDDPDGEQYGFWQDITSGCSVWCAVRDYQVEIEASSTLGPQGKYSYDAKNILDGTRNDAWVEGTKGNGIGETISITKSYATDTGEILPDEESVFFYEICIVNGLARDEKVWKNNGRVKSLKFYYNDEYQGTIELEDTMKPQFISLSGLNLAAKNNEANTFTFEIEDVYPGDKYEDTGITGIEIAFDSPNH